MYWETDDELYNDGQAFKITARDGGGVIFTILADNYYGYCKKEVKTQISFSANLYGLAEEEHAGGALAFQRRNHGEEYGVDKRTREAGYSFTDMVEQFGEIMDLQPEGYGIDKRFPEDLLCAPAPAHGPERADSQLGTDGDHKRCDCGPARSTYSLTATSSR